MPLRVGGTEVVEVKIGAQNVDFIYVGSDLVWQRVTPAISIDAPTAGAVVGLGDVVVVTATSDAEVRVANVAGNAGSTSDWTDYYAGITVANIGVPDYAASAAFDVEARLKSLPATADSKSYTLPDLQITAPAGGSVVEDTTIMEGTSSGNLEWSWQPDQGFTPDPGNS